MQALKKACITIIGGLLLVLGAIFLVIPGPSLLFIIPALLILSYEYTFAKRWLKQCMKLMQAGAQWLDQKIWERKYR